MERRTERSDGSQPSERPRGAFTCTEVSRTSGAVTGSAPRSERGHMGAEVAGIEPTGRGSPVPLVLKTRGATRPRSPPRAVYHASEVDLGGVVSRVGFRRGVVVGRLGFGRCRPRGDGFGDCEVQRGDPDDAPRRSRSGCAGLKHCVQADEEQCDGAPPVHGSCLAGRRGQRRGQDPLGDRCRRFDLARSAGVVDRNCLRLRRAPAAATVAGASPTPLAASAGAGAAFFGSC